MNVLSLFDGISVARQALFSLDIPVAHYYCCEIDKYAIQISKKNWSDNIHLGNVKDFSNNALDIDLLVGGSPCQDLSIAKKGRKGLEGDRSGLFWEYVRIKDLVNPKFFILENVASMPKKDRDIITEAMGVEPVMFNASLVSAQCRKRLFWTNIKFDLPEDRGILVKDILQNDNELVGAKTGLYTGFTKTAQTGRNETKKLGFVDGIDHQANRVYDVNGKIPALNSICNSRPNTIDLRKLTPIECERLQSLPDDYTAGVSNSQRYKCLGNAFNCEVIAHILYACYSGCATATGVNCLLN
jgi:site-specific DNA-cytosine methylase